MNTANTAIGNAQTDVTTASGAVTTQNTALTTAKSSAATQLNAADPKITSAGNFLDGLTAPKLADVAINKSDISEIVPNYPFVLSSASSILSAPEKNVWVHITRGPDGEPVVKTVIKLQE